MTERKTKGEKKEEGEETLAEKVRERRDINDVSQKDSLQSCW